jgi:hypothetical protein
MQPDLSCHFFFFFHSSDSSGKRERRVSAVAFHATSGLQARDLSGVDDDEAVKNQILKPKCAAQWTLYYSSVCAQLMHGQAICALSGASCCLSYRSRGHGVATGQILGPDVILQHMGWLRTNLLICKR